MKTWHVIIKHDEAEKFDIDCAKAEEKIVVPTIKHKGQGAFSSSFLDEIKGKNIFPLPQSYELLQMALGVYSIDQLVSRAENGYQGWSRHFKLYVPVTSQKKWDGIKDQLQNLLSFLSGDKWEITFRTIQGDYGFDYKNRTNPEGINKVALFSGGLDSYISAIDRLEEKLKPAFVSHYKKGGPDAKIQSELHDILKKQYGGKSFEEFQFYVQPNQKHKKASKESSSRARSFLFFCLGIVVANGYGDNIDLVIPENGLISLNVPLTGTRLSSNSTRTTHPYYLSLFSDILERLDIKTKLYNPYQFKTKGEMMKECKNQVVLKKSYKNTLSCSHPDAARYQGKSPGTHCGYCVPCIIRQASEKESKYPFSGYVFNIKSSSPEPTSKTGSDLRAFKIGLERLKVKKNDNSILLQIMGSGPIPFIDKQELKHYVEVYKRGMKEVDDFLN